jgi:hypothetical protein
LAQQFEQQGAKLESLGINVTTGMTNLKEEVATHLRKCEEGVVKIVGKLERLTSQPGVLNEKVTANAEVVVSLRAECATKFAELTYRTDAVVKDVAKNKNECDRLHKTTEEGLAIKISAIDEGMRGVTESVSTLNERVCRLGSGSEGRQNRILPGPINPPARSIAGSTSKCNQSLDISSQGSTVGSEHPIAQTIDQLFQIETLDMLELMNSQESGSVCE